MTPLRAGIPPNTKPFSMWSVSRPHARDARRLLRGVVEHPPHLLRVEAGRARRRPPPRRTHRRCECVLWWLSFRNFDAAHRHRHARADVVAERHGAQEARSVDAELLARPPARPARSARPGCDCDGQCESSVSSACASTPLASAASMGPATRFDPTTVAVCFPAWRAREAKRRLPRRQLRAGDHRREGVEDVMLGVLEHVGRQRAAGRAGHVRAERVHHGTRRLRPHPCDRSGACRERHTRRTKNIPASNSHGGEVYRCACFRWRLQGPV